MLILAILVIGLAAGWLAQVILSRSTANQAEALVAGLVGSLVGGLLASLIADDGVRIRPSGLIGSIAGAIALLGIWGAVRGRAATAGHR